MPVARLTPVLRCSPSTHKMVQNYSEKTGIPMMRVTDDIIGDWMESVAPARLEVLTRKISQFEKKPATRR